MTLLPVGSILNHLCNIWMTFFNFLLKRHILVRNWHLIYSSMAVTASMVGSFSLNFDWWITRISIYWYLFWHWNFWHWHTTTSSSTLQWAFIGGQVLRVKIAQNWWLHILSVIHFLVIFNNHIKFKWTNLSIICSLICYNLCWSSSIYSS
jgi:hypothetical protein